MHRIPQPEADLDTASAAGSLPPSGRPEAAAKIALEAGNPAAHTQVAVGSLAEGNQVEHPAAAAGIAAELAKTVALPGSEEAATETARWFDTAAAAAALRYPAGPIPGLPS